MTKLPGFGLLLIAAKIATCEIIWQPLFYNLETGFAGIIVSPILQSAQKRI
jgi:hypothetical protein